MQEAELKEILGKLRGQADRAEQLVRSMSEDEREAKLMDLLQRLAAMFNTGQDSVPGIIACYVVVLSEVVAARNLMYVLGSEDYETAKEMSEHTANEVRRTSLAMTDQALEFLGKTTLADYFDRNREVRAEILREVEGE